MRKTLLLLLIALCALVMIYFIFFSKKTTFPGSQNNFLPTPTPISSAYPLNKSGLLLQSTTPTDGATNILTNTNIVLTFNQQINKNDISFTIAPNIPFAMRASGTNFVVTPNEPLMSDTTYVYFVTIKGVPSYTYSFQTIHDPSITTAPDNASEIENEINKHNYPDEFLAQYTPYDSNTISVISSYSEDLSSYTFFVKYYNTLDAATKEFNRWGISLGLTQQQLQSLRINYTASTPGSE